MSARYRNRVTGQTVTKPEPSPRLDALSSNWERLEDSDDGVEAPTEPTAVDQAAKAAATAAVAAQHAADAAETASGDQQQGPQVEETRDEVQAEAGDHEASTEHGEKAELAESPERPAKSANRAAWHAYALQVGHTEDELAELTKAQIVALVDKPVTGS